MATHLKALKEDWRLSVATSLAGAVSLRAVPGRGGGSRQIHRDYAAETVVRKDFFESRTLHVGVLALHPVESDVHFPTFLPFLPPAALSIELESTSLLKEELGVRKGRARWFELPYAEVKKRGRRVSVTLDPDTANPFLVLSADQRSMRLGDVWQDVPDHPERFDTYPCVLGCQGLTSGRHYWEVEVGGGQFWAVGFAKESVHRKGVLTPSPAEHVWALQQHGDHLEALTHPVSTLSTCRCLKRVQVFLDYEEDQVAFFDADTSALIYVFSPAVFNQERIFPWLCVWPGTELRLYQ
ncbi:E3 ubiquitin-protein ligase TRIM7 [Varanus komodoensis]|nr:E3 ubiquitin-protein ligase TRIM7 [Varanus komodoensis]